MQQSRCALIIIFGFLLASASCGDEQVAPTSGAAGQVIAVQGDVSARRGDEAPRTLAVDAVVYVNDTVKTGESASVSIAFRHNQATWNLEGSKEEAVNESIAWRAKRQGESNFDNDQLVASAGAGRHVGQEALESGDTLLRTDDDQPKPEPLQLSAASNEATSAAVPAPDVLVGGGLAAAAGAAPPGSATTRASDGSNKPMPTAAAAPLPRSSESTGKKPRVETAKPKEPQVEKPKPGPGRMGHANPKPKPRLDAQPRPVRPPSKVSDDPVPEDDVPDRPSGEAVAKKRSDPLEAMAIACQREKKGSGTLQYTLTIASGKLVSFGAEAPKSLAAVVTCMRARLKEDPGKLVSRSGSITLK